MTSKNTLITNTNQKRWAGAVFALMLFPMCASAGLSKDAYSIVETSIGDDTEPSIAISPTNPDNIVIAWMKDPDGSGGLVTECWTARSSDGGATWTAKQKVMTNSGYACYDVSLAYKLDGSEVFLNRVEANNTFFTITIDYVRKSTDNGTTWPIAAETEVNHSATHGKVTDRPWVTVNYGTGIYQNSVYTASMTLFNEPPTNQHVYMRRYGTNPPLIEVDTSAGQPAGKCVAWQTLSAHGNKAYMAWRSKRTDCLNDADDDDGCFAAAVSSDGGTTWGPSPLPAADLDFVEYKKPLIGGEEGCATTTLNPWEDTFPYPVVAAKPSTPSTAVAVWLDSRNSTASPKDSDVVLTRTTDTGATWTAPSLVNTRTGNDGNGKFQDRPWAAYNFDGSKLFVAWRDRRDTGTGLGINTDLYVACSLTDGTTWTAPQNLRLSVAPGHKTATNSQKDGFLGVAASGSTGVAVWSTYKPGITNNRDLYFAKFTCN